MLLPRSAFLALAALQPAAARLSAEACFPTPETAVHQAIGAASLTGGHRGYRVEDVQVDPMMQRIWVRVRSCDVPAAPLIAVPLHAPLQSPSTHDRGPILPDPEAQQEASLSPASPHAERSAIAVHAGDRVHVLFHSGTVQMQMQGSVGQQALIGDTVEVVLDARPGSDLHEAGHRMRGVLRAKDSVEVTP